MKKVSRPNPMFLFSVLVILSSTWGVQRAQADPVGMLTGSWSPHFSGLDYTQAANAAFFDPNFTGFITTNPMLVCTGGICPPAGPPTDGFIAWSGTFDGGSVDIEIDRPDSMVAAWEFVGTITGGSFSGSWTYSVEDRIDSGGNDQTLNFTGTWFVVDPVTGVLSPIAWRSDGTLTDSASWELDGGPPVEGTLTLTTYTTPEPSGLTLLGLGMVAVGLLRLRILTNSSYR